MQELPIGVSEFTELRDKNMVYVDKTRHVYTLLTKSTRTFLSRPRRFGKSLLVSTLEAALQGKRDLFKGLWIDSSDYHFTPQGVIRLDFSELSIDSKEEFKKSLTDTLLAIGESYDIQLNHDLPLTSICRRLISSMSKKTQNGPIAILIDEYDSPILHTLHKPELALEIRNILKNFSAVIKGQSALVKFVFVTGVSAFSKSGLSSGLNNLENLTMDAHFYDICGCTDEEVDRYFKNHIENFASLQKVSYKEIRDNLKSWYNGYCFKENTPTLYSPFSFTCALKKQEFYNFWFESATPQFLLDEFAKEERSQECKLLELDKIQGSGDLLQTFEIESLPLPALLFQMGYLTIDSYDPTSRNYTLKYPNLEVRASLNKHLVATLTKQTISLVNPIIGNLYKALFNEDLEELINCLKSIISNVPYPLHIEEERYYHALLQTIFFATGIDAQSERLTNIGRMDLFLELPKSLYIIELKINQSPEKGLKQIETQKYYEPFLFKKKPILCLGLSFMRKKATKNDKSDFSITYAAKKI